MSLSSLSAVRPLLPTILLGASLWAPLSACGEPDDPDLAWHEDELVRRAGAPVLLQAGAQMVALGITDDSHALYWRQGAVYAVALRPGAAPELVARASAAPQTQVVGDVAMIWTAQSPTAPPSPGPLTVWTARAGAHQAATASWPPLPFAIHAGSAISPDGDALLFTDHVSEDGALGDVILASPDLSDLRTLVSGAQVHPQGACPPHLGFDRLIGAGRANPVALACLGEAAQTATLARWRGAARAELSADLAPGTWWSTDRAGGALMASRSDLSTVVFDASDAMTVIEPRRSTGWIGPRGELLTRVRTSPTTVHVNRTLTARPQAPHPLIELGAATGIMYANHLPQGLNHYGRTPVPTSPDGSFYGGFSGIDPNTGLTNVYLVDLRGRSPAPVRLRAQKDALPSFELATADSRYLLYYSYDLATGTTALHAGSRAGTSRQLTTGNTVLTHYGISGSDLVFSDGAASQELGVLGTTDIKVTDVGAQAAARVLTRAAHSQFFVTRSRRLVLYTTDAGGQPGLYAVSPRP